jgi:hypothetical protein
MTFGHRICPWPSTSSSHLNQHTCQREAIAGDRIALRWQDGGVSSCTYKMGFGSLTALMIGISAVALLAAPLGAFAQDSNKLAATFTERYAAEQTSTQTLP